MTNYQVNLIWGNGVSLRLPDLTERLLVCSRDAGV